MPKKQPVNWLKNEMKQKKQKKNNIKNEMKQRKLFIIKKFNLNKSIKRN